MSDMSFDALLDQALQNPAADALLRASYGVRGAALVIGYKDSPRRMAEDGLPYALAAGRAVERALRAGMALDEARCARRLRDGLLLVFDTPERALIAAFDGFLSLERLNGARRGAPGGGGRDEPLLAGAGLGFGELLLDPAGDAAGIEINAAFQLAGAAGEGEILATDAFTRALGVLPVGVGAHRGRADRVHQIGLPFSILRDYRA